MLEGQIPVLKIRSGELVGELSLFMEKLANAEPLINDPFGSVGIEIDGVNSAVRKLSKAEFPFSKLNHIRNFSVNCLIPKFFGCIWDGESIHLVQERMKNQLSVTLLFKSLTLLKKAKKLVFTPKFSKSSPRSAV